MSDSDTADFRRLLTRREGLLSLLLEASEPLDKRRLTDELPVARSTVDRGVRELEAAGLARRTEAGVVATLAGRLGYESFEVFRTETERVERFADLLRELPPTVDIPTRFLDGAVAYRTEPPATGRPANEMTDLFRRALRVRGSAVTINDTEAADAVLEMVTERGGSGEFVYAGPLADHIREEYFRIHHELVSTGRFRTYETETLPYDLFVVDGDDWTRVAVLVYDDAGTFRGTILNDTDDAVEWGNTTFDRRLAAATEFTDEFRLGVPADETDEE